MDASNSDAWMSYATQNSRSNEPCPDELALALDRAILKTKQFKLAVRVGFGPVKGSWNL